MKHNLKISVSKQKQDNEIRRCRGFTGWQKLLYRLFGSKRRVTIRILGDSVEYLTINEIDEKGGQGDEQN